MAVSDDVFMELVSVQLK